MAFRENTIKVVNKLVSTVRHRCELELPFTKQTVQRELGCGADMMHAFTELGIIVNGGGHGEEGNLKYKWNEKFKNTPNEDIVEMVLRQLETYRVKYYHPKSKPEIQNTLFNGEPEATIKDVMTALKNLSGQVAQLVEINQKQSEQIAHIHKQWS
jgi:hypothetical protein